MARTGWLMLSDSFERLDKNSVQYMKNRRFNALVGKVSSGCRVYNLAKPGFYWSLVIQNAVLTRDGKPTSKTHKAKRSLHDIYNQFYNTMDTGINTRMSAQALIQSSVFENVGKKAIFSESSKEIGYAVAIDVVLGGESQNTASVGTLNANSPPYSYSLLGSANVKAAVTKEAGQTLGF
ncbi:hypothetical protein BDP67DRAFT_569778 [Colletotrichum lupini]|nr:hypothetical protein BDP67DRAFT_569778 [Colletotrichum lupini]